jgi:hypothetical protein
VAPEVRPEWATVAVRNGAAMPLAHRHEESMVLVEQGRIGRQMRLEERASLLVSGGARNEAMTREHAARVRVRDEDGAIGRVEQDRVHRLGPEPTHLEQLTAELDEGRPPHTLESSAEAGDEPSGEGLESPRLHVVGPGRPDDRGELGLRRGVDAAGRQPGLRSERTHGPGGVRPGGMLREDGADGDLERRPARPPALRTEPALEGEIEPEQPRLDRIAGWPGDLPPPRESEEGVTPVRPGAPLAPPDID